MMFEQYMKEYVQEHADEIREEAREEGLAEGRAKGLEEGRAEGRAEGELNTLISLIKDGYISPEIAAKKLSISVNELNKYYEIYYKDAN